MADALVEGGEGEPKPFAEIRDPNYPEFYAPYFEQPPFEPPWPDWPDGPPPSDWRPPEPFNALHEACFPHGLPRDIEMAYGPPLPWIEKKGPPIIPESTNWPIREYLMQMVYDLCLQALNLMLIDRWGPNHPSLAFGEEDKATTKASSTHNTIINLAAFLWPERPVRFVARYLLANNPMNCKTRCRRHTGGTCYCQIPPPSPPPPPPPAKAKKPPPET